MQGLGFETRGWGGCSLQVGGTVWQQPTSLPRPVILLPHMRQPTAGLSYQRLAGLHLLGHRLRARGEGRRHQILRANFNLSVRQTTGGRHKSWGGVLLGLPFPPSPLWSARPVCRSEQLAEHVKPFAREEVETEGQSLLEAIHRVSGGLSGGWREQWMDGRLSGWMEA